MEGVCAHVRASKRTRANPNGCVRDVVKTEMCKRCSKNRDKRMENAHAHQRERERESERVVCFHSCLPHRNKEQGNRHICTYICLHCICICTRVNIHVCATRSLERPRERERARGLECERS